MGKENISIAIVDDSDSQAKVISRMLEKADYNKITIINTSEEALSACRSNHYDVIIIDCMLPKMNGIDLSAKIWENSLKQPLLIFISGIYKDKMFIRKIMKTTEASHFFTKPVKPKEIEDALNKYFSFDQETNPKHEFLRNIVQSKEERENHINLIKEIHGFDLPFLLFFLTHKGIRGVLTLENSKKENKEIHFNRGEISYVKHEMPQSFFGSIIIEKEWIETDELEEALAKNTDEKVPIGQKLINANLISPHLIEEALKEQMGLKLSILLNEEFYKINFTPTEHIKKAHEMSNLELLHYSDNWLRTKVSETWLDSFYLELKSLKIIKGPNYETKNHILTLQAVASVPNLINNLLDAENLSSFLEKNHKSKSIALKAIHILFIAEVIKFENLKEKKSSSNVKLNFDELLERLKQENLFARFDLTPNATDIKIKNKYHNLAKILHPDKSRDYSEKNKALAEQCYKYAKEAYETLNDPERLKQYKIELISKKEIVAEKVENLMLETKDSLKQFNWTKAFAKINEALKIVDNSFPKYSEIILLSIWSELKYLKAKANFEKIAQDLEKIPIEDTYNALFSYINGLLNLQKGKQSEAVKHFDTALQKDPGLIEARRELTILQSNKRKTTNSVDIFKNDFKNTIGQFFKKTKKS